MITAIIIFVVLLLLYWALGAIRQEQLDNIERERKEKYEKSE